MNLDIAKMICQRCQRSLRNAAISVNSRDCAAKCHAKDIEDLKKKEVYEGGDKRHQWRCEQCQTLAEDSLAECTQENLLNIISALCEKFELVNKIQLPKLSNELANVKNVSDNIATQNEEILRVVTEIEKRINQEKRSTSLGHVCRKRHLNLINRFNKPSKSPDSNDYVPMVSSDKTMRYRMRRRSYSYLLNRILRLLNGKLSRPRMSPRRRRR